MALPISHTTPATSPVGVFLQEFFLVPPTNLIAGTNLLAVEVHQFATNDDVAFALSVDFDTALCPVPTILRPPLSQTVPEGTSRVVFDVAASGTAPLRYQWHLNGIAVPDATNAALVMNNVEAKDAGEYSVVVTCQVLNEGVDVPAAGVGIVLGGTGSATDNVQRLGRILRKHGNKQAVLYEVISRNTAEEYVSDRRRQHRAFQ